MTDIDLHLGPFAYTLVVLFFAAPWYLSGGILGGVLWRVLFLRRWWIGAFSGAVLGGGLWALTIPVW